jgi:hypothetical protein
MPVLDILKCVNHFQELSHCGGLWEFPQLVLAADKRLAWDIGEPDFLNLAALGAKMGSLFNNIERNEFLVAERVVFTALDCPDEVMELTLVELAIHTIILGSRELQALDVAGCKRKLSVFPAIVHDTEYLIRQADVHEDQEHALGVLLDALPVGPLGQGLGAEAHRLIEELYLIANQVLLDELAGDSIVNALGDPPLPHDIFWPTSWPSRAFPLDKGAWVRGLEF